MPPIRAIAKGKRLSPATPILPKRKDGFTTNTAPAIAVRMHAHWKPSAASLRIIIDVSIAKKGDSLLSIMASDIFVAEIA